MGQLHIIFFLGKGGTGKSTASALVSLVLMDQGKKVLLASLDDAHNQSDIFEKAFSEKACTIGPCLDVLQIDREKEIRRYLAKTVQDVKKSYSYLKAFNLDSYFDILKHSPGMEEYALMSAFTQLKSLGRKYDYLVIDMPPTALSLRFFTLPSLSLTWIGQLEKLRLDIHEKKEIISKIKFPGKEFERDKTLSRIRRIKTDYLTLRSVFEDPDICSLCTVLNRDRLSIAETRRIIDQLSVLNIKMKALICNDRMPESSTPGDMAGGFPGMPVISIPYSAEPLIGMDAMTRHIETNSLSFGQILPS